MDDNEHDVDNRMRMQNLQTWLQRGMDARDAAYGLVFQAAHLDRESWGEDAALPTYYALAQTVATLALTEEVMRLRLHLERKDN